MTITNTERILELERALGTVRSLALGHGPKSNAKTLGAINHVVGYALFRDHADCKWVRRMKEGRL